MKVKVSVNGASMMPTQRTRTRSYAELMIAPKPQLKSSPASFRDTVGTPVIVEEAQYRPCKPPASSE